MTNREPETGCGVSMRSRMISVGLWSENDPRDPSKEIEAAWEVVEKVGPDGFEMWAQVWTDGVGDTIWEGKLVWSARFDPLSIGACADTAPMAICLAACKVAVVEVSE